MDKWRRADPLMETEGLFSGEDFFNLDEIKDARRPQSLASDFGFCNVEESMSMFQLSGMRLSKSLRQRFRPIESDIPAMKPEHGLRRSVSAPLTLESENKRDGYTDFFRSGSRNSRDTSSTLPLSPKPFFDDFSSKVERSDSVVTVRDEVSGDEIPPPLETIMPPRLTPFSGAPKLEQSPAAYELSQFIDTFPNKSAKNPRVTIPPKRVFKTTTKVMSLPTRSTAPAMVFTKKLNLPSSSSKIIAPRPIRPKAPRERKPTVPADLSLRSTRSHTLKYTSRRRPELKCPKTIKGLKYLSRKICETLSKEGSITQDNMISLLYNGFVAETGSQVSGIIYIFLLFIS